MEKSSFSTTGSRAVDLMCSFPVQGDVVPDEFYKFIKKPSTGKTDKLAVLIFSNIVYWHRPTYIYDNDGKVISVKKKFKGNLLQKNYDFYAEKYDEPKRSIKASFDTLEDLGLIKRVWKNITLANGTHLSNVLYIELCIDRLISLFSQCSDKAPVEDSMEFDVVENVDTYDNIDNGVPHKIATPATKKCNTYTDTNTKNYTNTIYILPSTSQSKKKKGDEGMIDDEETYRDILSENIEYESLLENYPDSADNFKEYFEIMVDLVCHNKKPIKVHGQLYPAEIVKSRMLKLRREHLERVSEIYDNYIGDIKDFYRHCAATLYNSYFEVNNDISIKIRNQIA